MLKNMMSSAKQIGLTMSRFRCYFINTDLATYGTSNFKNITLKKLELILTHLLIEDVLWIDSDIVHLQNWESDMDDDKWDIISQDDIWSICSGFIRFKKTEMNIDLVKAAIEELKTSTDNHINDQHCLQAAITYFGPSLKILELDKYQNGHIFYTYGLTINTKLIHFNYLPTTTEKIKRIKDSGFWNIDPDIQITWS